MDFLKKKFKIGKFELESWQLYLGIIASILGIVAFFKKSKTTAETPYTLNVSPAENTSGSQTDTSSGGYGIANYIDSSATDAINKAINNIADNVNGQLNYQNQVLAGLTATVNSLKSPELTSTDILNNAESNNASLKTNITQAAPVVAPEIHPTTAVVPTLADTKTVTAPSIINTTQAIADIKSGKPVTNVNDWKAVTDDVKSGAVKPSEITPASTVTATKAVEQIKAGNAIKDINTWNTTVNAVKSGSVTPSKIPPVVNLNTSASVDTSNGRYTRSGHDTL